MDAVALDLDVLIDTSGWEERIPGIDVICRRAASAAFIEALRVRRAPSATAGAGVTDRPGACLLLADDGQVQALNRQFLGRDEPTNVLAFPSAAADVLVVTGADGPPLSLGDIIIALETTADEAMRAGKPLDCHLSHLVVHGVLHLLGFDHQVEDQAIEMEALERRALSSLGIDDPYADDGEN